jgi:hypothetical protein
LVLARDVAHVGEVGACNVQARGPDRVEGILVGDHPDHDRLASKVAGQLPTCPASNQPGHQHPLADALIADQEVEVAEHDAPFPGPARRMR